MPKKKKQAQPLNVVVMDRKRVRQYEQVPGAPGGLPQFVEWWNATKVGDGRTPRDPVLRLIDRSVSEATRVTETWARLSVLGQLYWLTDHWLKKATTDVNPLTTGRQPAVADLFLRVVDAMCQSLKCTVNYLPQFIEEIWGRILTSHGLEVDRRDKPGWDANKGQWEWMHHGPGKQPTMAQYLSRAEAEKYRLMFQRGLAYQLNWYDAPPDAKDFPFRYVLAESSKVGWGYPAVAIQEEIQNTGAPPDPMFGPGYAGFALSMGRDFYMARHVGLVESDGFFHSSYLSGDTVLCTGSMLIQNGRVKAVKNDSGHYRPTLDHLVNVVQTLEMYGVPPHTVTVEALGNSWTDDKGNLQSSPLRCGGDTLLKWRATGIHTYLRYKANGQTIQDRKNQQLN